MSIRVALIEDEPAFRNRFREIISTADDLLFTGEAASLADGLALVARRVADVYLVDLGLPDGDGIELVHRLQEQQPEADVMIVSVFGDDRHVVRSIKAGATGYILKDSLYSDVVELIRELHAGGSPISPGIARRLLTLFKEQSGADDSEAAPPASNPLSARETEILRLVAKGLTFDEIAKVLNISTNTVNTHVRKVYRKLSVNSRAEAVFEATQLGLLKQ